MPTMDNPDEIMSLDDYRKFYSADVKAPRRKYHNVHTVIDKITFDSALEAEHYLMLKDRLERGEISDLVLQPVFILQDRFRYRGHIIRAVTYRADFMFTELETGLKVVWDSKGKRLPIFNLKEKLFLKRYGETHDLRVVGGTPKPRRTRSKRRG